MSQFMAMPIHPSQLLLFAHSDVMDDLNWAALEVYPRTERPAYPPRILAKILVYAYSKGVRSSRKIEELVENDKQLIWMAGGPLQAQRLLKALSTADRGVLTQRFEGQRSAGKYYRLCKFGHRLSLPLALAL
jgi:hypothetical protein